ncbi:MAG: transglycosylase domain-containing protein, partial [Actinomycetota bacterium]
MPTTDKPVRPRPAKAGNPFTRWWGRRSVWGRRLLLAFTVLSVLVFISLVLLITVASRIPVPDAAVNNQTTIVQFADGRTELGRLTGAENRVEVPLTDVPEQVQNAVLAAEDRNFYRHGGVSFPGLARAALRDLKGGGAKQGGSTISQQYAKNAFNARQKTFARKFREAVIAIKLEQKYTKQQILELYLNEIYFGRGAYGIEAASRTYYNKAARTLTQEEGAFLAGIIQSPSNYDPDTARGKAGAERRFRYVLGGLVKMGKYDAAKVQTATFPMPTRPRTATSRIKGPRSYILDAVRAEVRNRLGIDDDAIYTGGYRIRTTIDARDQAAAESAIKEFFASQPPGLQQAIVSLDPQTGSVRAMYAGRDDSGDKNRVDYTGIIGDAK